MHVCPLCLDGDDYSGPERVCKACITVYHKSPEGKAKQKRATRKYLLKAQYNLTEDKYDAMVEQQDGMCAICEGPSQAERLSIDHDHVTGRVRGLLCGRCNSMLGFALDKTETLRRATMYLEGELGI